MSRDCRRFFFGAALSIGAVASAGTPMPPPASAAEVAIAKAHIPRALANRDDLPSDQLSSFSLAKNVSWSDARDGYLLLPIVFRFKGAINSYCRVVTLARGALQPVLVDVPQQQNVDACRGFRNVRYLDMNGDGLLDIAASVTIKSNAFNGYVDELVVYLSSSDKPSGYCYSDSASRNLRPEHMLSKTKIKHALDEERKRLGIAKFECAAIDVP